MRPRILVGEFARRRAVRRFLVFGGVALLTSRPRGTADIVPPESARWQSLEAVAREVCRLYGYAEIRTPTFEHSELFHRGVGDTSDIVEKETYTFEDRGKRSITLRPEGTAGVVRAYLENGLHNRPQPVKLYYLSLPIFRYEKPQAGRLREHHQFGVEALGSDDPRLDAEVIALSLEFVQRAGLTQLDLHLNSIGCPACRPRYREALVEYYRSHIEEMCADCRRRLERNPLRLLDCKTDRALAVAAPRSLDFLCDACRDHFKGLQAALQALGIRFTVDPTLVRGLDYYTRTVFEFTHGALGAQNALFGGGRYDGLAETLGGPHVPGVGFGLGMERLLGALAGEGRLPEADAGVTAFVIAADAARAQALPLVQRLRAAGVSADTDFLDRSFRAQFKAASRYPARFAVILGEEELSAGAAAVKDLETGSQETVSLDDLVEYLRRRGPQGGQAAGA
ncbi:MAG: histidine--tRNA ligase [Clostridia bacterium]|nr:histidine--tRNA ligase [Clostridia bacterium]